MIGAGGQARSAFDVDAAATKLIALAAAKREARAAMPAGLYTITDFPEPTAAWYAADQALRDFGAELAGAGGARLMADVYDTAAEADDRLGYRAVQGVSISWTGLAGWSH